MKNKNVFIIRLIYSTLITILLIYLFNKINRKIVLIPFLISSFAMLGKNILILIDKQNYVRVFDKIFIFGFLSFWFGFLTYGCYTSFIKKDYILLLFSIPFWIGGMVIIKKSFLKTKNIPVTSKTKSKFNFKIIVSSVLVITAFLAGILMSILGISDTYKLNKKTKDYITTNGYYKDYDVYNSDKDGITYKLTYVYEVDNKEYSITTNYGTNYIPAENSIRKVRFNPNNPEEAVLVGTNNKNGLIFMGAFFTLVSFTFVILALTILGYFDKFKIDIIGTYIGAVCLIIGIGIILFQNGTTMSLIETIKSFGLWILIPFMFIVVGIIQLVKCLFLKNNKIYNRKK